MLPRCGSQAKYLNSLKAAVALGRACLFPSLSSDGVLLVAQP